MMTVFRWPIQARVETRWVDAAGAEVGALARGEDDARVLEQLAHAGGLGRRAGQRAGGGAAVGVGLGEDVGDVPVRVVVREDRAAVVVGRAGGAEIAGGRGDRVLGVIVGHVAVVVAVDAVGVPR